ncbi:hypothetical protein KZP23_19970 [Echinicola marina]|uniref:hypothetical protein n=1 Tax=Echinicola marina TaxID=2859768 RepID=UPI001CF6DC29|nr:hypothetical protein [Echinicola marina]UCS92918.1 hypothetical protein KZP23_19970 [Echinicola marina]
MNSVRSKVILVMVLSILGLFGGCSELTESIYTDNVLEYELNTISTEYGYTGRAIFREYADGTGLQLSLILEGESDRKAYFFPAHLHQGSYGEEGIMLEKLNPVDIRPLKSVTILKDYTYEKMKELDGHIKVHLAEDGPDYNTILVAGNIGANAPGVAKE